MNQPLGRPCTVEGCDHVVDNAGAFDMCSMHYQRLRRQGTTDKNEYWVRSRRQGAENNRWTGDDATYMASHLRVRKRRGRASEQTCIDCGDQAAHWSYNNAAPNERLDPTLGRYSPSPEFYDPRCVPCHSAFDKSAREIA